MVLQKIKKKKKSMIVDPNLGKLVDFRPTGGDPARD